MNMTKAIFEKFLNWAKLKFNIHIGPDVPFYFREREIWWASLGANIGYEEEGKNDNFERPILILKKFNRFMLWGVPLTSKNKTSRYYYQFEYKGKKFSAILSQLRVISSKRLLRKVWTLSEPDFNGVKDGIKKLL